MASEKYKGGLVALRKESVDRNRELCCNYGKSKGSLSARRAWIEIIEDKEVKVRLIGRSPQGERG